MERVKLMTRAHYGEDSSLLAALGRLVEDWTLRECHVALHQIRVDIFLFK